MAYKVTSCFNCGVNSGSSDDQKLTSRNFQSHSNISPSLSQPFRLAAILKDVYGLNVSEDERLSACDQCFADLNELYQIHSRLRRRRSSTSYMGINLANQSLPCHEPEQPDMALERPVKNVQELREIVEVNSEDVTHADRNDVNVGDEEELMELQESPEGETDPLAGPPAVIERPSKVPRKQIIACKKSLLEPPAQEQVPPQSLQPQPVKVKENKQPNSTRRIPRILAKPSSRKRPSTGSVSLKNSSSSQGKLPSSLQVIPPIIMPFPTTQVSVPGPFFSLNPTGILIPVTPVDPTLINSIDLSTSLPCEVKDEVEDEPPFEQPANCPAADAISPVSRNSPSDKGDENSNIFTLDTKFLESQEFVVTRASDTKSNAKQNNEKPVELPPGLPSLLPGIELDVFETPPTKASLPPGPPYVCTDCNVSYQIAGSYRSHIIHRHLKIKPYDFPCDSCSLEFQCATDLKTHCEIVHQPRSPCSPITVAMIQGAFNAAASDPETALTIFPSTAVRLEGNPCIFPGCLYKTRIPDDPINHYIHCHSQCSEDAKLARTVGCGVIRFDPGEHIKVKGLPKGFRPMQKVRLRSDGVTPVERRPDNLPATFRITFPKHTLQFRLPEDSTSCPYCSKAFEGLKNWTRIKEHIRDVHLWPLGEDDSPATCPICSKVYKKHALARRHARVCKRQEEARKVRKKRNYSCDACGKTFQVEQYLVKHKREVCNRRVSCEICGLTFTQNYKLAAHMISHATERPFFCETCGKNYKSMHTLKFHQKISHTEDGRLKYNEYMRMKDRKKRAERLRKVASAPITDDIQS